MAITSNCAEIIITNPQGSVSFNKLITTTELSPAKTIYSEDRVYLIQNNENEPQTFWWNLEKAIADGYADLEELYDYFVAEIANQCGGGGGGSPAGSDTQIQYNNAGAFGASSDLTFDPATSTLTTTNNWEAFRTSIKFAGPGGTNDLTASAVNAFTGTTPTTFAVLAYGNIQIVNYINLVGGNFSQGDTITGSVSGAEGYVAYDDGVGQFYVSITNSIQFAATDVIDNANGVTADYDTSTTSDDIFFWFSTNGGSGGPIVMTGTAQTLNDGIDITFGSTTGHGAGDSWEWSYKTLKNTVLSNRKIGSGIFGGAINGSYFKSGSGSSTIQAMNGFFQNGNDDRIFSLSAYEDLTSGNNSDKERAYYGFNPFKGDPAEPLEFIVQTQKGVGLGPFTPDITGFKVNTVEGFRMETNKSILMSSSNINLTDTDFNVGLDHTTQSAVTFTGSGLDGMNVAGSGYSGTTFPNTYTVEITQNNAQLWALSIINPGVFIPGETLTGLTSGETAFFVGYAGTNNDVIIVNSVSGTFTAFSEDIIGNLSGVTQQFNFAISTNSDVFTLTTSSGSSLGCTNAGSSDFTMGLDGVYPQFTSSSGYTIGDSWTWTYTTVNQNVLDFSNNDYKFQSTFGTDTFGYQIGDNILGYGITGAVNSWSNSSDFALSGLFDAEDGFGHNTLFNYGDGTNNKISLLKNSVVLQLNNSSSQKGSLIFSNISFALTNNTSSGNRNGIIFNEANSGLLTIGNLSGGNGTSITIDDLNEHITISNLPAYDDDTAAGVGGLTAGMVYMTTGSGSAPLNAAGILMIKQ